MVKLSATITDINGQGPGGIWRKDQCGNHLQKPPRKVKKHPSDDPFARQRYFQLLLQFIREHATVKFVLAWTQYAIDHPTTNKKGEKVTQAWAQAFISYNMKRFPPGIPIIEFPPGYPKQ